MKLIRIISEHKQKRTRGQFECIVQLDDGEIVTKHIFPYQVPNWPTKLKGEQQ